MCFWLAPSLWADGAGAPLAEIEVVASTAPLAGTVATLTSGAPTVVLHGRVAAFAADAGVSPSSLRLSISHSGAYAVAVATATTAL